MLDIIQSLSLSLVVILLLVYLISGFIKGMAGFGMPMISIPASTLFLGASVPQAMSWALVSVFATNIVQISQNWRHRIVIRTVWPLVLGVVVSLSVSVQLLAYLDGPALLVILGVMILISVASQSVRPVQVGERYQAWVLGVSGLISGAIGGLTSFFGFPALQSLVAIDLTKDQFVLAVSLMFLIGGIILAAGLGSQGLVSGTDAILSCLVLAPSLLGMKLGRQARNRLSVRAFQRVVLVLLLVTGLSMMINGLVQL